MCEAQDLADRRTATWVLATHPEGQSLFAEAGHCRALAERSATAAAEAFADMQATRLGYEELRHRQDPRGIRTVHFGVALTLLAVLTTAVAALGGIEFADVLAGWMTGAAAAAAAAAWAGWAWLAGMALRDRQRARLAALAAAAVAVALLLAALHAARLAAGWAHAGWPLGAGVLATALILALVTVGTMLIARTEPASFLRARRRWHQARADHAAAVRIRNSDAEAAVIAGQAWRNLIKSQTTVGTNGSVPVTSGQASRSALRYAAHDLGERGDGTLPAGSGTAAEPNQSPGPAHLRPDRALGRTTSAGQNQGGTAWPSSSSASD